MKGLVQFEKPKLQCWVFGIETQVLGFIEWAFKFTLSADLIRWIFCAILIDY